MAFEDSHLFNSRELSWIDFDDRVLDEASDKRNPLLERLRFVGISQNNLDEFVNIRVASLHKMISVGYKGSDAAGLTPKEQLKQISIKTHKLVEKQYDIFKNHIVPALNRHKIKILKIDDLSQQQKSYVNSFFDQKLYPVLTPMAVDVSRPFPFITNDTLNIALRIYKPGNEKKKAIAFVQVPDVFPRVIKLPFAENSFIMQEDIIKSNINKLFVGSTIREMACFTITRDMDMDVAESDTSDLMKEIEQELKKRQHGKAMRIEFEADMSSTLKKYITKKINLHEDDCYAIHGPVDLTFVNQLISQVSGHADLMYPKFEPYLPKAVKNGNIFNLVSRSDLFFNHPYDSFDIVTKFIQQAAEDENSLAIKITLYRVSSKSPIIKYLKKAAANGKQVTVLVELKARFDEENNVHWAHELEKAGCHVIYGLVGLKTHCKLALIIRKEGNKISRYMHMATGNYNESTAKHYTDMCIFTKHQEMGMDATNIFNMLSGFSQPPKFHKLTISPNGIRNKLMDMLDNEIKNVKAGHKGFVQMKMNSLSDPRMIRKLYEASAAGVKINLIVRGICNLKVGIPNISENISVHSIVGQFLEHSRIYCFYDNGNNRVFLSSADLMNRNLSRRVELLFPILNHKIKNHILWIYEKMWNDNVKTRFMLPDSTWQHSKPNNEENALDSQKYLLQNRQRLADDLLDSLINPLRK
ncbi:RNA degradosome polyphosphate kinase [Apilactobacillus xinyiensis]|uniref:RNA degradosome polyphosphate kinase n=1 Tax=Apilactobacillus xinyiensis TaxID=2841032 RepID=UPI0024B1686D|nr:RNA degradosome polyphosphate kinase [Apilactobacillus xinyiensis]